MRSFYPKKKKNLTVIEETIDESGNIYLHTSDGECYIPTKEEYSEYRKKLING